ncbi:insulinase family protein [Chitinophagaceae bacterium LB-8]|uniref:Insulinase family protein n=1 Tax=Paraflavisolibacter caeni TaxID=2982496 RepID=A0A9X2XW91_9BACT|nr:M16 family metallopeptidase [Paraflavisolibacter caeni]MCU7548823.1 insulinase family protein [Paraflavisolibacter caeni]
MRSHQFLFVLSFFYTLACTAQKSYEWKQATSNGYTYKYVLGDPMQTRFYTLKNGLSVILSENHKEPRISMRIPVRTGSNNDPKDHTGLAHYLEHLLFKGTDQFGSLNWAKEKPLLDKIEGLYEQYNSTTDVAKRKNIYHQIDSVSGLAAKFAIAGEYDNLMKSLGSQGTNAHTWVEETVYDEDIPSNAIDKLLDIQAERFRKPVFRIFHTELEAVYEEKNRGLDNDAWKIQEAMHSLLFPTHNYGQQTTIGTIEHLKNPSLKAIQQYYDAYYVPNNMAIILAGDFNPDQLIKKIDAAFAYMQPRPVQEYQGPREALIKGPVVKNIYGPSAETMRLVYRVGKANSREAVLALLASSILSNGNAGLLDLNINKQQKALGAGAGIRQYKDYGLFQLAASPKQGQTLEDVKDLLLQQVDILRKGQFDESLIKAIVANYKFSQLEALEDNSYRTSDLVEGFIQSRGQDWNKVVAVLDEMGKVSKKEIVDFANGFFKDDNYVVIYKRKGEDKNKVKVEKPAITPVETNAGKTSAYVSNVLKATLPATKPVWIDFAKDLQKGKAGGAEVLYVPNKENSLFRLYYHFNIGSFNNKLLPLAIQYLQFLGTNQYTAEEITKAFYNLAANFNVNAEKEETTVSISGLEENFTEAVSLFEHLIHNCKPDASALQALKDRVFKTRANNKLNKQMIASAMRNYALYGANNPFNYGLSDEEIKNIKAEELVDLLHQFMNYQHAVLYYGPLSLQSLQANIRRLHQMPQGWASAPAPVQFARIAQTSNRVLFSEYDAVQAEVFWSKNLQAYQPKQEALINLFNSYFGNGMGTVVFKIIRESKALAYSTYAVVQTPVKKEDPFSFIGYVGAQADKLNEAIGGMNELLNNQLPVAEQDFENARKSLIKDIETERITKEGIIFAYLRAKKKGVDNDLRKDIYQQLATLRFKDISGYHQQQLVSQAYTYSIIGSASKINVEGLKTYGEVRKLDLKELFGY